MKTINVEGKLREDFGKAANRRLRKEDYVPGVIYGGEENIHFYALAVEFQDAIYVPELCKVKVSIDGEAYETIIKDAQFHPVSDIMLHIDLLQLTPGKLVITDIPIKTEGKAAGVEEGGVLVTTVRKLKVRAVPEQLREFITVDVTNLELNKTIKIRELNKEIEGIEILNPDSAPVATVVTPRALRSRSPMEALGVEREGEDIQMDEPTPVDEEGVEMEEASEGAKEDQATPAEGEGEEQKGNE